jgi:copper homeostasis protein CutC
LARLQQCGVRRVITTGRAANVMAGKAVLKHLVELQAQGKSPVVTAATGVTAENVQELLTFTEVQQVHASKFEAVSKVLGKQRRPLPPGSSSM